MRKFLFTLSLATSLSTPALAQSSAYTMNGTTLYQLCVEGSAGCGGYVIATVDMMFHFGSATGHSGCLPRGVTYQQYTDAVQRYLARVPHRHRYAAFSLVIEALDQAFPCGARRAVR